MPVYEQSYRHYEGTVQRRLRWIIVIEQELRVLSKARVFTLLMLPPLIHCVLRLLQVVAYDVVIQDVNNPLTPILKGITAIMVNERMSLKWPKDTPGTTFFLRGLPSLQRSRTFAR